ncbi:MAG: ankyrin repeat domain-containing protein [Cyanobacteria bacterium J06626_14]
MTNPRSLRQRAQAGDLTAIATLINRSFQKYQVKAEVHASSSRLTVRLMGQSVPDPTLATTVQKGLQFLKLTQFSELMVMGCLAGDEAVTWIKRLSLSPVESEMTERDRPEAVNDRPMPKSPIPASSPSMDKIQSATPTSPPRSPSQSVSAAPQRQEAQAGSIRTPDTCQSSSHRSFPKKWIGIGLCFVGIMAGGVLYTNWSRLQIAVGRTIVPDYTCSAGFLAAGGALGQFRLSCVKNDPEAIATLWIERTADNPNQLDARGKTLLQTALEEGLPDLARQALEHGVDPSLGNKRGSPLALATGREDAEMVQLLLDRGADVTYAWTISDKYENALTLALRLDDLAIAKLLLEAGMEYVGRNAVNLTGLAETNDFDLLETLIEQGFNINEGETYLPPPIEQAIEQNNITLVRFLLDRGVTLHENRLQQVIRSNQQDIAALLLEHGAQVESEVTNDDLITAVANNNLSMVIAALDNGDDVNQIDSNGYTPLTKAVSAGASNNLFQLLISRGANVNQIDGRNFTPLSLAARSSYGSSSRMMELLLSQGAQINQLDGNGFTPLMRAILNSKYDAIDLLIAKGADVEQTSADGKSVLAIAISTGPQLVDHLLAKGANFDPNDPLSVLYAIDQGDRPLLETLISQGANLNQIASTSNDVYVSGRTPLTAAIANKSQFTATLLLDNGAQLNFPDPRETPLTAAIDHEQWEIVDQLLERGANYNQAAPNGQTPLNQAIRQNNIQLVKRLLDMGADPNQQGENEYTPLMATLQPIGQPPRDLQIIQALLDSGAELGKNEMFRAIRDDHIAIVRLFLDHGWNVNATLYDNHTTFSVAVGYSTPEMAQMILDRGANTNWRGHHNFTLMDLAEERDDQAMMRFLRINGLQ